MKEKPIILIVDDEPTNLTVLTHLLQNDYQVRACKSGRQALEIAQRSPAPDLILLDVMMPEMDGYAALTLMRKEPAIRDIPVIFVTALSDAPDEELGFRLGAVDYISKPVKPALVQARVRAHIEIKQARDILKNQNEWLEQEVIRRTNENLLVQEITLNVILELAEARDSVTGNHITRIELYSEALCRELGRTSLYRDLLDSTVRNRIVKASLLHDIGKIGIPDAILLKPGRLTPEEMAIMKRHTTIGAEALRRATGRAAARAPKPEHSDYLALLEIAEQIACSHHERWDGAGYPEQLAGTDIPLPARILALIDVWDALVSPRPYKAAWTPGRAADYILSCSGTHFDPDIVAAFVSVRNDFEKIHRQYLAEVPSS